MRQTLSTADVNKHGGIISLTTGGVGFGGCVHISQGPSGNDVAIRPGGTAAPAYIASYVNDVLLT